MKYEILNEAIHPKNGETYKIGDKVVIYQGRFGHDNIITLNTMFKVKNDPNSQIYVTDRIYTKDQWLLTFPNNPQGTYIGSIKRKITDKEIKAIKKARDIVSIYGL